MAHLVSFSNVASPHYLEHIVCCARSSKAFLFPLDSPIYSGGRPAISCYQCMFSCEEGALAASASRSFAHARAEMRDFSDLNTRFDIGK